MIMLMIMGKNKVVMIVNDDFIEMINFGLLHT